MALNCSGLKILSEPLNNRYSDDKTKSFCRICFSSDGNITKSLSDYSSINHLSYGRMLDRCVPDHKLQLFDNLIENLCNRCGNLIESAYELRELCMRSINRTDTPINCVEINIKNEFDIEVDCMENERLDGIPIPIDSVDQIKSDENDMLESVNQLTRERKRIKNDCGVRMKRKYTRKEPRKICICTVCDKRMACNYALEQHMRTHSGEKPFICEICGKGFTTRGGITVHMNIHSCEKLYHCCDCTYQTSVRNNLRLHFRKHNGEKPYACPHCGARFSNYSNHKKHIQIWHEEAKEKCEFCDEKFKSKGLLRRHIVCHYRERQFACTVCSKMYARHKGLIRHMKSKHPGIKWPRMVDSLRTQQ